ncbi:MAG: hypothetical protein ACRDH5_06160, partial [bacterium]
MASTRELIRELHEKRLALREEQKAVFAEMEGSLDGEGNAERKAKFDALDKEIITCGERIRSLMTILENAAEADKDREHFEKMLKSETETGRDEEGLEQRLRTFMRASLPDAEVWA